MSLDFSGLDSAIANFEGFGIDNSVATRNNNPGNLIATPWSMSQGAVGQDSSGFAIFPDVATGAQALDNLVKIQANNGLTLSDLINKVWAPPTATGNTSQSSSNYTDYVSNAIGLNPSSPVSAASGKSALDSSRDWLSGVLGLPPSKNSSVDNIVNATPGAGTIINAAKTASWFSNLTLARAVTIIIGIIVIGAGLLSLKPVQNVVTQTGKVASKIAA